MSCSIYAIIEYRRNVSLNTISDKCFEFISIACNKKIAINRVNMAEENITFLKNNEMGMEISNSYVFCIAEDFVKADFSQMDPLKGERLKELEQFLSYMLQDSITNKIRLYLMTSECYNEEDFTKINCEISGFTESYKETIFSKGSYAYEFIFDKHC